MLQNHQFLFICIVQQKMKKVQGGNATALAALPRLAGGVPVPAVVPAATPCGAGAGTVSPVGVCLESSHTVAWVGGCHAGVWPLAGPLAEPLAGPLGAP